MLINFNSWNPTWITAKLFFVAIKTIESANTGKKNK